MPPTPKVTVKTKRRPQTQFLDVYSGNAIVPKPHTFGMKDTYLEINATMEDAGQLRVLCWVKDRLNRWVRIPRGEDDPYREMFDNRILRNNANPHAPNQSAVVAIPFEWGESPYGIDDLPAFLYDDELGDIPAKIQEWVNANGVVGQKAEDVLVCDPMYTTCCHVRSMWLTT